MLAVVHRTFPSSPTVTSSHSAASALLLVYCTAPTRAFATVATAAAATARSGGSGRSRLRPPLLLCTVHFKPISRAQMFSAADLHLFAVTDFSLFSPSVGGWGL